MAALTSNQSSKLAKLWRKHDHCSELAPNEAIVSQHKHHQSLKRDIYGAV